ncbi:MAG: rane-associated phospholipid phosphatase [Thermoleophilia bacterium]|nr:rane-associated phospholipid phosphatase [Thermoleophilia bacterium]
MAIASPIRQLVGHGAGVKAAVTHTFPREARSANQAARRLDYAEYTQGFTTLPTAKLLQVPGLQPSLDAALAAAHRSAGGVRAADPQVAFDRHVLSYLDGPPSAADELDEVQLMVGLQQKRTDLDERIAGYYANGPAMDWFDAQAAQVTKGLSVADAARAQTLLDEAFDTGHATVGIAKQKWERLRPYQASSELQPAAYKPADGGSFPSGHTSNAFAVAHVLGALNPAGAAHYLQVANTMAHSRAVAGAHFPSDTVAGAFIGTRAGIRAVERNADFIAMIRAHNAA